MDSTIEGLPGIPVTTASSEQSLILDTPFAAFARAALIKDLFNLLFKSDCVSRQYIFRMEFLSKKVSNAKQ